jgi:pimeloyl-ACP methyl ester carboxylesterase
MTTRLTTTLPLAVAALLLAACSREAPPPAPAPAPAAAPVAAVADGTPRILAESTSGLHIQYRVYGSGEPLIVLIHGWSCDSNYWSAQVAELRKKYTVATVDLAGHGGSGANRTDWSIANFGDDVARVVNAMPQHPKVILVGHSMGGPVAVEAARRLKGRVAGIIGVDTLRDVGTPKPPAAQASALFAPFEKDFIGATRGFVTGNFFTPKSDPVLVRRIADDMSSAPPEIAIAALRGLNAWDGVPAFADAGAPIVLINAALPATDGPRLAGLSPGLKVVTLDGVGHFLMMEDPARFNVMLGQEIQALMQPAPAGA